MSSMRKRHYSLEIVAGEGSKYPNGSAPLVQ